MSPAAGSAAAASQERISSIVPVKDLGVFGTGLLGTLLVGVAGQLGAANLADIQAGIAASADEVSLASTAFAATEIVMIVLANFLIRAFGLRRFMTGSAAVFALASAGAAFASSLDQLIVCRALQGFASGGFGPAGFTCMFRAMASPARLPAAATVLAFTSLVPASLGVALSAVIQDAQGWPALFWWQAGFGLAILCAAAVALDEQPLNLPSLRFDWTQPALAAVGLALLVAALTQGTRRFWFENDAITLGLLAGASALAGFLVAALIVSDPPIDLRVLAKRSFGVPMLLNLAFRAGLLATGFLVPQFLATVQGYRPLETTTLMLWILVPQLIAGPLVWAMMRRLDGRWVMGMGLLLFGGAALSLGFSTNLSAGPEFRGAVAALALAQALFLVPCLVIGTRVLAVPKDLPHASFCYNVSRAVGTAMGGGFVAQLVYVREHFHSNTITETVSLYGTRHADRIDAIAGIIGSRLVDEDGATRQAVALLAAATRREAYVLAYNDAFLALGLVLLIAAPVVVLIGRAPPVGPRAGRSSP